MDLTAFGLTNDQETDWQRVQDFFGRRSIDTMRSWFEELRGGQATLPILAASLAGAQVALNLERADKGDDLDGAADKIDELEDKLALLKTEKAKAASDRGELARRLESGWYRFWYAALFRTAKKRVHLAELDERLETLVRRVEIGRTDLERGRQREQTLLAPIKDLQKECVRLETETESQEKLIRERRRQIHEAFLQVVQEDPSLPDRLQKVAASCAEPKFFCAVMARLDNSFLQERALVQQLTQAQQNLDQGDASAEKALDQLARSVAIGFHVESVRATASVNLEGSVSFHGGASGSASGQGSGRAEYEIDQVSWKPEQGLSQASIAFSKAYSDMGAAHALRDRLTSRLASCRQVIAEYLAYICDELTPQARFGEGQ